MKMNTLALVKQLARATLCALTVSWGAFAVAADAPANRLTRIEMLPASGGKTVLQFQLQDKAVVPAAFSINSPPKISMDFIGTENGLGKSSLTFNDGGVRSINVIEVSGRTRVVLNLENMVGYETKVDGNKLLLTLGTSSVAKGAQAAPSFAPAAVSSAKMETVRDIDFRRGKNGEGRLIVDLSSANSGIDIRQQGNKLLVDIFKTKLPSSLERRMDVSDFATPVLKVDSYSSGDNVQLLIEPQSSGNWEHSAYQTDNRLIIEIRAKVDDKSKIDVNKHVYKGEKLSLNFQNVEVRTVLQVIAEFTGRNIITSDSVNGGLTLRLKDVPWDQALDLILQSRGLDKRENGNVIWIAPRDELAAKEKLQLESQQQIVELEQLRTETIQMKYQKASDMAALLSNRGQSILSKRGSVVFDQKTNTLLVNDVPSKLEEMRQLIAKLDVATRQVLIEARIVEANDTFGRSLGARLFFVQGTDKLTASGTLQDAGPNIHPAKGVGATVYPQNLAVNLPANSLDGALGSPGSFAAMVGNSLTSGLLGLELSALEADGKGKVVSSPRIMTADQIEASIEYGEDIPFQKIQDGSVTVEFKKAVLRLLVTPQITPDDQIIMKIKVNKDSRGQTTPAGFAIDTKNLETLARVENGGTIVIGGIYQEEEGTSVTKIPFLGDIPYLGALFKTTKKTSQKRELLVFITPKIMKDDLSLR